jgi:transglutaminase-like putative cysteine protease
MRERVISEPVVRERVVVDPPLRERVVTRPSEVEYVVGDRVPATVELAAFPDTVIRDVPAARGYRYMIVNDRLLLVDPMTSTVVEEIVR